MNATLARITRIVLVAIALGSSLNAISGQELMAVDAPLVGLKRMTAEPRRKYRSPDGERAIGESAAGRSSPACGVSDDVVAAPDGTNRRMPFSIAVAVCIAVVP